MERISKLISIYLLMVTSTAFTDAFAGDEWYVSTTINGMAGNYSGSDQRNDLVSASFILNADYLDNFSFALAYNSSSINFKDLGVGEFKIKQDAFAGQLQYHFFSDSLGGKLTAQIVAHSISNDDTTTLTDEVTIYSPKLAYLNFDKDLYLDFEYVNSSYPNNGNLSIQQYSPTIGLGLNNNTDWLRFKAYLIQSSDKNLSQGVDSLSSVDIKWSHWLSSNAFMSINNFFIDTLIGKRIYAVDNDAFSVYNLADIQLGSVSLGAGWKSGEDLDITFIVGTEKYVNNTISNEYYQQYLYISLTKHW